MALFLDLESLASLLDEEPETDVEAEEQEPVTLICSMRFCRFWNWAFIRA